jgi:hypothetical protein
LLWLGVHDGEFEVQRQIRLLRNWLSFTVSCAGAGSPILRSRYADVGLISATLAALMMPLAFMQAC